MSAPAPLTYRTPKVFLLRHGPTEWSLSGRYTSTTDLSLLPEGETQVRDSAALLFGEGKLIDPRRIGLVLVSPRVRARRTWDLFSGVPSVGGTEAKADEEVEEDVREWEYGSYEGLLTKEIRQRWKSKRPWGSTEDEGQWDIWRDGCSDAGGESPKDVTVRVDRVAQRVVEMQGTAMREKKNCDVVIVAHGHILRVMVKRWIGAELSDQKLEGLMFEAGGIAVLSYQHENLEERAVVVGMAVA